MALGKRKPEQQEAWVAATDLPRSPGHPFYRRLNQLLADAWLEVLCRPYYAEQKGRPSIPPGTYFHHDLDRLLRGHRQPARHCLAVLR